MCSLSARKILRKKGASADWTHENKIAGVTLSRICGSAFLKFNT